MEWNHNSWPETTAKEFINRLNDLRKRFEMVGTSVKDDSLIIKLIKELPKNMEHIKMRYEFLMHDPEEKKKVKYDSIYSHIIESYMAVYNLPQWCFNCRKGGHFDYECYNHKAV